MSGVGAGIVPSWHAHIASSVFVVAEGDREADYFRPSHDIVVPGKLGVAPLSVQRHPKERKLLACFRGSLDAALRNAEGVRVHKENRLRRWLADLLVREKSVVFSGQKSKR
jgi:hypothetical protein